MKIPHYFFCEDIPKEGYVTLSKDESIHFSRSLRGELGDKLHLIDGQGTLVLAIAEKLEEKNISCKILYNKQQLLPQPAIHLYIAPSANNVLPKILRQSAEMGVRTIHIIESRFSVAKISDKKIDKFTETLKDACKQSRNPFLPKISPTKSFSKALKESPYAGFYGAMPEEDTTYQEISKQEDISLWVGPEGGFSKDEINQLNNKKIIPLVLGNYVLRTETAVPALLGKLL